MISLAKLPKWFGERPGRKAGDPESPEGEEDVKAEDEIIEEEVGAEDEEVEEVVEEEEEEVILNKSFIFHLLF